MISVARAAGPQGPAVFSRKILARALLSLLLLSSRHAQMAPADPAGLKSGLRASCSSSCLPRARTKVSVSFKPGVYAAAEKRLQLLCNVLSFHLDLQLHPDGARPNRNSAAGTTWHNAEVCGQACRRNGPKIEATAALSRSDDLVNSRFPHTCAVFNHEPQQSNTTCMNLLYSVL